MNESGINHDLVVRLEQELKNLKAIRWAYLFGSAAESREFGDVDIAIMPEEGELESPIACGTLGAKLGSALGLNKTVDVVDLRTAPLPMLAEILEKAYVLLDREPEARRAWEFDVTLHWLDFAASLRQFDRLRLEALEREAW